MEIMAYNVNELVPNLAQSAHDVLLVEGQLQLNLDFYFNTGLADAVYAAAIVDPYAPFEDTDLTSGEIEAARIALAAITTLLDANTKEYRKAITKIINARPVT